MAEEVRRSRHAVPRAMFWSVCLNGLLAFCMALVLLFFMGDVEDVTNAIYGLVPICINATGSVGGGSAMVGLFLITVIAVSLGVVASVSRLTWAWSRDGALPKCFSRVHPRHRIPVRSVWLPIVLVMVLCLLNFISDVALGVIISLSTFGLYQSYAIAIGCIIYTRAHGGLEQGGWSLGSWGWPINVVGLAYTLWVGVFLVFPNYLPLNGKNMNYALPINVCVWIITVLSWYLWGKKRWLGINLAVQEAVIADSDRNTKD